MVNSFQEPPPRDHSLVRGGVSYQIARRLRLEPITPPLRLLKIGLLIVLTWVPLVVLTLLHGHAWGSRVVIPLLYDPVIYSRFLFVVPLLELAQYLVEASLGVQMRHFLDSGLVPERDRPLVESARDAVIRMRGSVAVEAAILVLAVTVSVAMRVFARHGIEESSWERVGTSITPAGWWYILVSLPVLGFFLARWVVIFGLWAAFLFHVSRVDLKLTPTHPDHAGGLGFLGWGVASFAIVLMAVSAVISGSFAREIIHHGSSLYSLKYHVIIFVVAAVVILHVPMLAFTGRLARCRFRALLEFGSLAWHHDRAFDEKWVEPPDADRAQLLGSPDVESLANVAEVFEHVNRMSLIPFDKKALVVLIAAAIIPMIPLIGTAIPLVEIFSKLGEFLV
jgi:hypothetical protein